MRSLGLLVCLAWLAGALGCASKKQTTPFAPEDPGTTDPDASTDGPTSYDAPSGSDGSFGQPTSAECKQAASTRGYIGCEYWPTITPNSGLADGFDFAIAIANPGSKIADVSITRKGKVVTNLTVGPGALATVPLPWINELRQPESAQMAVRSLVLRGGAYRLTSSLPIVVYQFNPLEYHVAAPNCGGGPLCFSYTNDASLLLPTSALRGDYAVVARPTHHYLAKPASGGSSWADPPGFVAVTASHDGTNVTLRSTANTRSGPSVNAMTPGATQQWSLDAGDVLVVATAPLPPTAAPVNGVDCSSFPVNGQGSFLLCPSPTTYDLTGSTITADQPVSVISGHDCDMVPFDAFACDHLEESLLPTDALGTEYVVTAAAAASPDGDAGANAADGGAAPDGTLVRVLATADATVVHVEPSGVQSDVTLNAGQFLDIGPISKDVVVSGSHKIAVAQFMVGENWNGRTDVTAGDPSQSSPAPTAQHRTTYTFLAPTTYDASYVNVVARKGGHAVLDGKLVPMADFTEVGTTGWLVAREAISGGTHTMTTLNSSDPPFGITVYGYGRYTSYMYPGGLDLTTIHAN